MQQTEITKMKSKLEKILAKIYMPSQDEIIDGLNPDVSEKKTNILKGHL
jgi:uncharacterized coiled-coil protein SlyX